MRWYPGQTTDEITERETKMRGIARKAASEGMVLLENNGVLPLKAGMKLALFGQGARYTIKGGTGSGDVNSRNTITVDAGLRNAGYRIVNDAWLDRFDEAYAKSLKSGRQISTPRSGKTGIRKSCTTLTRRSGRNCRTIRLRRKTPRTRKP
ncbi:MAG: glycoside hydrolase family 3 C-terminal domain-containing protein [Clostridia bacterium]|nr:glycoside hydrolase family 3 C-terminal domain-containing protein [Clostridia bacterium]